MRCREPIWSMPIAGRHRHALRNGKAQACWHAWRNGKTVRELKTKVGYFLTGLIHRYLVLNNAPNLVTTGSDILEL